MEVSVQSFKGIPDGSILSIRAGQVRRQGNLALNKPMSFNTGKMQASPFKIDVFAPLASSRITLSPQADNYAVNFKGEGGMELKLLVKEASGKTPNGGAQPDSPNAAGSEKKAKGSDSTEYIEKHQLLQFVQNLMQSVLAEKPSDPLEYMEEHLRSARGVSASKSRSASLVHLHPDIIKTHSAEAAEEAFGEPGPDPSESPNRSRGRSKTEELLSPKFRVPSKMDPSSPSRRRGSMLVKDVGVVEEPKSQRAMQPTPGKTFTGCSFAVQDSRGAVTTHRPLKPADLVPTDSEIRRLRVPHLTDKFSSHSHYTPLTNMTSTFKGRNDYMMQGAKLGDNSSKVCYQMLLAGPRKQLHFNPNGLTAAIVTCGGLCPGLNAVIREVVMTLHMYGVSKVYGIKGGYKGVLKPEEWLELSPDVVQDVHTQGGTLLVSDRGNPPHSMIAATLKEHNVRAYFVIGGDGTLKGGNQTYDAMSDIGWECAVIGIPKTIDNDIPIMDKTFGFDTACTEARKAIDSAYVEATCNANCIGLVKLMGRHAGFIAMNACLAARNVDICLLPEMTISLEKVLQHCLDLMQTKGHAVVVVAEGCGDTMIEGTGETDAGGNKKLGDVGAWLKRQIEARFKEVRLPLTIKYIDPTYMIRAIPPNSNDSVYCTCLAQNAVHAAMAGYTGVTVGRVQMRYVFLPIDAITTSKSKRVDIDGASFQQLINSTNQPVFTPDKKDEQAAPPKSTTTSPDPLVLLSDRMDIAEALPQDVEIRRTIPEKLSERFGEKAVPTTLVKNSNSHAFVWTDDEQWVTQTLGSSSEHDADVGVRLQMLRAGPRKVLHFQPDEVAAAIVTCGGLCPGLNSVIREVVMMLHMYGVRKIYGIIGGYWGVTRPHTWITLTPESVQDIHMLGGSILQCNFGNPPPEDMAQSLKKRGIRSYFVVGGDGTHRGANQTLRALQRMNHECAVIGIPQAVENDIALMDKSFGFDTACTHAEKAIAAAYVEATCNSDCIGMVKVTGFSNGYIAMQASLAARNVDICLLPEMDLQLERVLEHITFLMKSRGSCVLVVAEGCSKNFIGDDDVDVGLYLKTMILDHFAAAKLPCQIKYLDPTNMIRAVAANANDSVYCSVLAQGAVHAAMAGYTGVSVCKVDESYVYVPISVLTDLPNRKVNLHGPWAERLIGTTLQPSFGNQGNKGAAPMDPSKVHSATVHRVASGPPMSPSASGARSRRRASTLSFRGGVADEITVPDTKLTVYNGFGDHVRDRPLRRVDVLQELDEVRELSCFHLGDRFGRQKIPSPIKASSYFDTSSWSTQAMLTGSSTKRSTAYYKMVRAGPRGTLHFDANDPASCAAIVSCGGICPGLNSVIREIVNSLWQYGVRKIWGIIGGYKGVMEPENWIRLTPAKVRDIHMQGGTLLVSDRGNPPHIEMAKVLQAHNVKQYFVLGGDGSHKGAMQTFDCCLEIDHECAVVGVPKTIDNDVPMVDRTFGFDTACEEAKLAVESAYVEANSNANCIGLVKLMGRHCGHITMTAALAASFVDVCLLPEMDIDINKVMNHIVHLMETKGHAVIVVAEGCGDTIISNDSDATDAGGNKIIADVGPYLKTKITDHFKALKKPLTIKFIDPTYMIRSVPANSFDSVFCSMLAQNAVHGALAGYSGITVGVINGCIVYLPIHAITKQKGKRVDIKGSWFQRMLQSTKQPDFSPDQELAIARPGESDESAREVLALLSTPASINTVLQVGDCVKRLEVCNLKSMFPSAMIPNPLADSYLDDNSWATRTLTQANHRDQLGKTYTQFLLGGPREYLHFDPKKSNAVIVTCGGLCPGLNSVIRELTIMLKAYGVENVYGCKGGYKGLVSPENWIQLNGSIVQDIHLLGGSILVSDRGNPPHSEIAKSLQRMNIRQYFVLGGDGTHKGGMQTFDAMMEIGHECAVVGIPKTIDNDIAHLDRSFGFNTACTEAARAISSAHTEAVCSENCIGLVKLMGRHCGFVALGATLAARHVDICLLPEMDISLPKVLSHLVHLIKTKKHAVIVVAEGCGDTLISSESAETDAGGNKIMADVGAWLREQILKYFEKMHLHCQVKYTDPTYMIRAVAPNANDNVYCTVLAQYGVHAAMAGFTGISIGKVDEHFVMLPIHCITNIKRPLQPQRVNIKGRQYQRMLLTTGQPNFSPGPGDDWALLPKAPEGEFNASKEQLVRRHEISMSEWKHRDNRPDSSAALFEEINVPETKLFVTDGNGAPAAQRELRRADLLQKADEIRKLEVMHLKDRYESKEFPNPIKNGSFQDDSAWACQAFSLADRLDSGKGTPFYQMLRAGPRKKLFFDPTEDSTACAAILTCGALCPGLNSVIREITLQLHTYGVQNVYGLINGFSGVLERDTWESLTSSFVEDIHHKGGSVLGCGDGFPAVEDQVFALKQANVRQLFCIGGDGTQRRALQLLTGLAAIDYECAVMCVPKTIDNDAPIIDKTFGFDTACMEARKAIDAAYVEATCNANCIGLVKLLGQQSGFIALNAAMSSRVVDICLLPEMKVSKEKMIAAVEKIMEKKKHAVIVVSEGFDPSLADDVPEAREKDFDHGVWWKDYILKVFKEKRIPLTIKYIDPTSMIQTVPANASDSIYCSILAQHAVHGAMAGFTGCVVARVYERYVYLPIAAVARTKAKRVNTRGRWMYRLVLSTRQPNLEPEGGAAVATATPQTAKTNIELRDISVPMSVNSLMIPGDFVQRLECNHLAMKYTGKNMRSPLAEGKTQLQFPHKSIFLNAGAWTTTTFHRTSAADNKGREYLQMLRSGPREMLHWDPTDKHAAAAIVTCGGICPGLNTVIREVVMLLKLYGVKTVWGIVGGYKGFLSPERWIELTEEVVQDIHNQGGSILVSDRGNPPHSEIARTLKEHNIKQYFVLGGDGTQKGAFQTFEACQAIDYECSVVGIPKTIDNDIQLLDTSFGFDTACTEAGRAIESAAVEASTNANCIGLVKLMGRHCGFIAMMATLAARAVDICLIPEMDVKMDKLLAYIEEVMKRKKQMVIVVAEGCGDTMLDSSTYGRDAGGNKVLPDVGPVLKEEITSYLKNKGIPISIKYIDPTYMIRSVPANAFDSVYCSLLAQHAVHGAMAGYTGITVGKVDERYVMLPIHAVTTKGSRTVDVSGRMFERMIATTRQPSFA